MKKILLTLFTLSIMSYVLGQNPLEGACQNPVGSYPCLDYSPEIIVEPTDLPTTQPYPCFDWTVGNYRVAIRKTAGTNSCLNDYVTHTQIRSPFYPSICNANFQAPIDGQINSKHFWLVPASQTTGSAENLRADRDMFPSQGWVLLFETMGRQAFLSNGVKDDNYAHNYPSFILYNKYTGVLRVFFYEYCKPNLSNGVEISLLFSSNSTNKVTRLFDDIEPVASALDGTKLAKAVASNITNVVVDGGTWYIADFMTAYDPCLEDVTSGLEFSLLFKRLTSYDVNLKVNSEIVAGQSSTNSTLAPSPASSTNTVDYNGLINESIAGFKKI